MGEIFYKTLGTGKPVVFLHGLLGFHRNFYSIAKALEKDHLCVVYDQRLHGRSIKKGPFTLERLALDLKDLLSSLNLKKVNLVGHSMGGYVASYFTSLYPKLVEKQVIVDSNPWPMSERFKEIEDMLLLLPSKFESEKEIDLFFNEKMEKKTNCKKDGFIFKGLY